MKKTVLIILLIFYTTGSASVINSYWLVWDTSKIASFGWGYGYNFNQSATQHGNDEKDSPISKIFGPVIGAELGITGYEYLAGLKFGTTQYLARSTYLFTIFAGKSKNWINLKTNIENDHFVLGARLNKKFVTWAIKYHTDFDDNKMISVQFGLGE